MAEKFPVLKEEALRAELARGRIVPLTREDWEALAGGFPLEQAISTGMAGKILLIRWSSSEQASAPGWALVERPEQGARVVRPMASEEEARALIADRLQAYERMWDG